MLANIIGNTIGRRRAGVNWSAYWVRQYLLASGIDVNTTYFTGTDNEITGGEIITALTRFAQGLRDYGLWDKLISFHPLLGGTIGRAKLNFKNPLDTDAAQRFENGANAPTWGAMGVTGNDSNQSVRTHILLNAYGAYNNYSFGVYFSGTGRSGSYLLGAQQANDKRFFISPNFDGSKLLMDAPGLSNRINVASPSPNYGIWQSFATNGLLFAKEDNKPIAIKAEASVTMPDIELYLLALNKDGVVDWASAYTISQLYWGIDMTEDDNYLMAVLMNNLQFDLKRIAYVPVSKTLTVDNSDNTTALNNYVAEINLSATEFDFGSLISADNLNVYDGSAKLIHTTKKYDSVNSEVTINFKADIPASTSKTFTLTTGQAGVNGKLFKNFFTRKTANSNTVNLWKFDTVADSMGVGSNVVLNNASLLTNRFGTVLDCNGINSAPTLAITFPDVDYDVEILRINWVLKEPHTIGSTEKCVLADTDLTHLNFILTSDGKLKNGLTGYKTAKTYWAVGEVHSISIRATQYHILIKADDVYMGHVPVSGWHKEMSLLFGTVAGVYKAKIQYFDLEKSSGLETIGEEYARNNCLPQQQDKEFTKWQYVTQVPNTVSDSVLRQEPSILAVGTELHLYCTDREVAAPGISRRISTDNGVTWSAPVRITLNDQVSNSERPYVFQYDNKLWMICHKTALELYIYESVDGLSFTNGQLFLAKPADAASIENGTVYLHTDGKWYGVIECGYAVAPVWRPVIIRGDSLTTMSIILDPITSLGTAAGVGVKGSGPFLRYGNNKWQLWSHSYSPSLVFRHTNEDITQDTWAAVYTHEILTLNSAWGPEQCADFSMCEKGGVCYAAVNNSGDFSGTTGNTSIYVYDGTLEELITDLSIVIS